MIYSVFGQRDVHRKLYEDYENVQRCMTSLGPVEALILGGGKGLDALAERWAYENNVAFTIKKPEVFNEVTQEYRGIQQAFNLRDKEMIEEGDVCVVFWDGVFPHMAKLISKIVIARKTLIVFPL